MTVKKHPQFFCGLLQKLQIYIWPLFYIGAIALNLEQF